jgi:potassium efflux system protein
MKRKLIITFLLITTFAMQSNAVLKEKDLSNTLSILRTELTNNRTELEKQTEFLKAQQEIITKNLISVLNQSNENALMLYSQKQDYIFDLTYACNEATEQYRKFRKNVTPFINYINKNKAEIARYDSLISSLSTMPDRVLTTDKSKIDRNVCLTLAINIRHTINDNSAQMADYIHFYAMADQRLRDLNNYANKKYQDIQTSIFKNGGDNYFAILSNIGNYFQSTQMAIYEKYRPTNHSQWDSRVILSLFTIILIYALISIGLNLVIFRFILTSLMKRGRFKDLQDSFFSKRACIIMGMTVVTFALILGIVRVTVQQNFIIMASNLLVEYAWLLGVILISLLLRLDGNQIKSAFRIYSPLIAIGFIVITFRIILIPNDLVNILFPPILLICTLWQWNVITRHSGNIPRSDVFYSYVSLTVFLASVICSWIGYTLMSVQLLIWWVMQLTCILTITCISRWLNDYAKHRQFDKLPITRTWFYNLIYSVLLPTLGVASVIIAIYWSADVFNMSDTTWMLFKKRFIDSSNFSVSIITISQVIVLYFIFKYINKTVKAMMALYFERNDQTTAASRNTMARNVIQIIVWGLWLLISLAIFHVSNTWLVVISGGLSTGVGFASKDILENIYYGLSLMAGRIKIGDYIECDGTRGKVNSISYTSTTIETIYGSIIAFQNSQLFTKNYKNMTRNHGYELDILEVGVAYGTDIEKTRTLLENSIIKLNCIFKKRGVKVVLKSFADSSIILKILVWVPVLTQYYNDGEVMECVYKTLRENNIEIPYPQRDIHIIHAENENKE